MSFIPGGYESFDSDDSYEYDSLVYVNDPLRNSAIEEPRIAVSVQPEAHKNVDGSECDDKNADEPRKAFLWPPKPPQRSRSPSPSSARILDDIRTAIINGNLDSVKSRIEQDKFFVDSILRAGWTPLLYAASRAQPEIVHYLLENNADPNYHTKDEYTALMAACGSSEADEKKILECVHYLLRFGADCNAKDKHLNTPLILASKKLRISVASELIDAGANLDVQEKEGWTPLHYAAHGGCGSLVKLLIERGAKLDITSNKSQTAVDVAFDNNHKGISDIIQRVHQSSDRRLSTEDVQTLETPIKRNVRYDDISQLTSSQKRYVDELDTFLSSLNLTEYKQYFINHKITFRELLNLTEENLEQIGIKELGVRKQIITKIPELHKSKWKTSSLVNLRTLDPITCPDAVAMMANIAKHLAYIEATVGYLRQQINKQPRILEYGKEAGNVQHLIDENRMCLVNSQKVFDEVKYFTKDLNKLKNNPELLQNDEIDSKTVNYKENASWAQPFMLAPVIMLSGAVGIFVMLKHKIL